MRGELTESMFDSRTFSSDTILNYQLSQKFKLIKIGKFNHLIISLMQLKKEKESWIHHQALFVKSFFFFFYFSYLLKKKTTTKNNIKHQNCENYFYYIIRNYFLKTIFIFISYIIQDYFLKDKEWLPSRVVVKRLSKILKWWLYF